MVDDWTLDRIEGLEEAVRQLQDQMALLNKILDPELLEKVLRMAERRGIE